MTEEHLTVVISAHDPMVFDMIITCPNCDTRWNNFVSITEFVDIDGIYT